MIAIGHVKARAWGSAGEGLCEYNSGWLEKKIGEVYGREEGSGILGSWAAGQLGGRRLRRRRV